MKQQAHFPNHPLLLALACLTLLGLPATSRAQQPNIIVFFTDDHGWGDLGAHGAVDDIRTPHLDELAGDGVLFKAGYITAPQCIPSRAGILSGQYQQRFGVDDNRYSPMPSEVVTLPERLREAGYVTGMVGKWHLDPNVQSEEWLKQNVFKEGKLPPLNKRRIPGKLQLPYKPQSQGFDEFFHGYIFDYSANFDLQGNSLNPGGEPVREEGDRLDIQTNAGLAFIERNKDKPFFLYLAYFAPHVPLASTPKYLERFPGEMPERRRYALAMISAIDDGVGRIRDKLAKLGKLDNTLIFFIGDNGAPLKIDKKDLPISHQGGAWDGSLNDPFTGEKGMLTEGGIRVPFIMSWPNQVQPGQVSESPVISLDVAATALAAAGVDPPDTLDGINLVPVVNGETDTASRPLFWRFWTQAAIRKGDWKYLRAADREYLFNLAEDPAESINLIRKNPEMAKELRSQWKKWNQTLQRPYEGDSQPLGPQEKAWFDHYLKE